MSKGKSLPGNLANFSCNPFVLIKIPYIKSIDYFVLGKTSCALKRGEEPLDVCNISFLSS